MKEFRKLTPRDLAFGIGRKATSEEIKEWLSRPDAGESVSAEQILIDIKKRSAERRAKKN